MEVLRVRQPGELTIQVLENVGTREIISDPLTMVLYSCLKGSVMLLPNEGSGTLRAMKRDLSVSTRGI